MKFQAVLVYIRAQSTKTGEQIILQGRLSDGQSYGIVISNFKPGFYIPEADREQAQSLIRKDPVRSQNRSWGTMRGEPVLHLEFETYPAMKAAHRLLQSAGIACYEGDLSVVQQFLIKNTIGLCFSFTGEAEHGDRVDLRFRNPHIHPSTDGSWLAEKLRIIAIDIETNRSGEIRCISLAGRGINRILTLTRGLASTGQADIIEYDDEKLLLEGLIQEFRSLDPDIVTGWNVIGFDMAVVMRRMKTYGIAALLGRSRQQAQFIPGNSDLPDIADLPGRQVIDAMRLQRMHPRHFESYSLEHVASEVLGRGKSEQFGEEDKMDRLDALWENDPQRFVLYCLEDSRLVIDLLDTTGLIDLTLKRSELCGSTMSRAWASIHSFEQLYIRALHKRNLVAPDLGVDRLPMTESPGGTILFPESGLFERVLLLDFKGLYPSIIRTFGIDPLAHIAASITESDNQQEILHSPNGAAFLRGKGILPEILTHFYQLREEAKHRGDDTASYAFKILANSFYGVLGTPGCRFAGSDLATAITSFAREILYWSRDFVQELGYRAIYGDTDSLFLIPPPQTSDNEIFHRGLELSEKLNAALSEWVGERYGVESYLEIEFENLFAPFFIPPLKSVASQEIQEGLEQADLASPQGRAKSYAGLAFTEEEFKTGRHELIIKGMEAVRSDWTALAREVQKEVLRKILTGAEQHEIRTYLSQIIQRIQDPEGIELLVIKKRLSKSASQYRGNLPPHVRAALLAEKKYPRKASPRRIQYLMTRTGPEPFFGRQETPHPDISWYVEKQMLPVLQSINAAVPYDLTVILTDLFHPDGQLALWSQ